MPAFTHWGKNRREGILGNYNRFNLKGKAVVIETTYQLNQGSILHHEYKERLLIWQRDILVYKHVQEYWQFWCLGLLNLVPHLPRKFVSLHATNNSYFQWLNHQCFLMKLHDPTNKEIYNHDFLLALDMNRQYSDGRVC